MLEGRKATGQSDAVSDRRRDARSAGRESRDPCRRRGHSAQPRADRPPSHDARRYRGLRRGCRATRARPPAGGSRPPRIRGAREPRCGATSSAEGRCPAAAPTSSGSLDAASKAGRSARASQRCRGRRRARAGCGGRGNRRRTARTHCGGSGALRLAEAERALKSAKAEAEAAATALKTRQVEARAAATAAANAVKALDRARDSLDESRILRRPTRGNASAPNDAAPRGRRPVRSARSRSFSASSA